jgi:pimeloyl-ACP methyl ester carboxylesterase
MKHGTLLAAIDLGSNSFRLEIGRYDHGQIQRVAYLKETVRQGNGLDEDRNLTDEAMQRGWDCLARFAERLAARGIVVFTYDKRGVGESGGIYTGPEVGTNNVDSANLSLLAKDASAALNKLNELGKDLPIGLIGFSQAGWIIPIAATLNPSVDFMVLFSGPTITSLEQLRFQFHTNGDPNYWENHSEADARQHIKNDPDRFQFTPTDPKNYLAKLSIPGLWLYGAKDIQVPVQLCIEQLNRLKVERKPFDYRLYLDLGHNTASSSDEKPVEDAIQWIKQTTRESEKRSKSN